MHHLFMKTNKRAIRKQRSIVEQKLKPWIKLQREKIPPSGWIRAVRGALGISSRQVAKLLGVNHSTFVRLEEREKQKKVTLETLEKAANAMDCKLIYAIVPKDTYSSLEDIIDEKSFKAAEQIVKKTEHSMRLELQGRNRNQIKKRITELANELKDNVDSQIWDSKNEN